jgi:hypothetical protein
MPARCSTDPVLLADYAEVLSRPGNGKPEGKPTELVAAR